MGQPQARTYSPGMLGWLELQLCVARGSECCRWGGLLSAQVLPAFVGPPIALPHHGGGPLPHPWHSPPQSLSREPSPTLPTPPRRVFSSKGLPLAVPQSLQFPTVDLLHPARLGTHSPGCRSPPPPSELLLPLTLFQAAPHPFSFSSLPRTCSGPFPSASPQPRPPLVHTRLTERPHAQGHPGRLTTGQPNAGEQQAQSPRGGARVRSPHRGARGLGELNAELGSRVPLPAKARHTSTRRPPSLSLSGPGVPSAPPSRHLAPP